MTMKTEYRASVTTGALIAASLVLSGCLGPTYGTDKPATVQLMDDLGSIASIGSQNKGAKIDYKPRPAIVKPADTVDLPVPQQDVAKNNPAWVESPEETRKRLVAAADAGGSNYRSPLAKLSVTPTDSPSKPKSLREALKIEKGAYSDRRRFLSDPPLAYRKPAATAPVGDLGVPEAVKERRRLAAARKASGKRKWWPW